MSDAPVCKCGAGVSDRSQERCANGHPLRGFRGPAWRHGLRSFEDRGPEALPAELRTSVEEFRDQLIADRGGIAAMTAIERQIVHGIVEVETVRRLSAADLARRGLVKGTFDRWVVATELFLRYAARLGMDRKARHVDTLEGLAADIVAARREVQ